MLPQIVHAEARGVTTPPSRALLHRLAIIWFKSPPSQDRGPPLVPPATNSEAAIRKHRRSRRFDPSGPRRNAPATLGGLLQHDAVPSPLSLPSLRRTARRTPGSRANLGLAELNFLTFAMATTLPGAVDTPGTRPIPSVDNES